ncbi:hypothetical protein C2I18_15495 [Paenibacillus sp. PK3_47]|nr:hypothetical protein C2I18_15495 [Paenibacillus sp. PK3_47]
MVKSRFTKIQRGMCLLLVCILLLFPGGIGQWAPIAQAATASWSNGNSGGLTGALNGVAYGNGKWLIFSAFGDYSTSDNGTTFSKAATPLSSKGCQAVAAEYTEGQWVVVCANGVILTSPTGGDNWTQRASGVSARLTSIAIKNDGNNAAYVAVGETDGAIISSSDGHNWRNYSRGDAAGFYGVTYGEGKFIAVGDSTDYTPVLYSSTDGVQWNRIMSAAPQQALNSIAYGNGKFVTVGFSGYIYTSDDGVTWQNRSSNISKDLWSVTYGAGKFYAAGANETIISSQDGITWEKENGLASGGQILSSIKVIEGRAIAVGSSGAVKTAAPSLPAGSNALLGNLQVTPGSLTFNPATRNYTTSVPYGTTSVTVTPTLQEATATMTVKGAATPNGQQVPVTLEADGSTEIPIVVIAQDGTTSSTYTITVNEAAPPANSAPTQINLTNTSVAENMAAGTVVGTLTAVDPDSDETAVFELISGDTDAFEISGNQLITKRQFDYETKASYSAGIRVKDKANHTFDRTFTILVVNVNEAPAGSIHINSSAAATQLPDVTLYLTASDPENQPLHMQFSNDNVTWSSWEPYTTSKSWILATGDGTKTVYMKLRDSDFLESAVYSDNIMLDTTAPDGSLSINYDAVTTSSQNVVLDISGSDANVPVEMRFSNETGMWSAWEPVTGSKVWTLTSGDGTKTVTVELRDALGNVNALSKSISLDTTLPIVTGVTNGQVTNQELTITFNEGTATLNGHPFNNGSNVGTEGDYTLIVTDPAGNTSTVVFTVDKTPPTAEIAINNGAAETLTESVNLTLSNMQGGAAVMRFSSNGVNWSTWEPFAASKAWTLENGADGLRTVYAELRDAAGNIYPFSDTITLDTTAPAGTITINEGAAYANSASVSLSIEGTDASGAVQMRFSNDEGTWSSWENVIPFKTWVLSASDGNKTVHMELRDGAGNTQTYNDTIVLDTQKPVAVGVTNGQLTNQDLIISFNEGTATVDGQSFQSGDKVTAEGPHTLIITDEAGNETTIVFTIDKTNPSATFSIQNGDGFTRSTNVNLTVTNPQGAADMAFSNDNSAWSAWEAAKASKAWTLEAGDGTKTVYMKLRDEAGNTADYSGTIILDSEPPTGSVGINSGAAKTGSTDVTLHLTGSDPNGQVDMRLMNDGGSWTDWMPFSSTKSWTLRDGEGIREVTVEMRDQAGNTASFNDTIELDQTKPIVTGISDGQLSNADFTITFNEGTATLNGDPFQSGEQVIAEGSYELTVIDEVNNTTTIRFSIDKTKPAGDFTINGGASHTGKNAVTLEITASDNNGAVQTRFSNNGSDWSAWEEPALTQSWNLAGGEGIKTVYMEIRDPAGNTEAMTRDITLDMTKPIISGVTDGQLSSSDLTISFNEGVATLNGQPFTAGATVGEDGSFTLEVTDAAGNKTSVTFTVDKKEPTSEVAIESGALFTASFSVNLSITDVNSGEEMRLANEDREWSQWEPVTSPKTWNVSAGDGVKSVYMEVRDKAGNIHSSSDTIVVDTIKPTGSLIINGGGGFTNQQEVTLGLTAHDLNGPVQVRFSNGDGVWSAWESAASTKSWMLENSDGAKSVTMEVRDAAGNMESFTDTINFDAKLPIITGVTDGQISKNDITITFNEGTAELNGQPFVNGTVVSTEGIYHLTVTDASNNQVTVRFSIDKTAPTAVLSINDGAPATNTNAVRLKLLKVSGPGFMRLSNDGITWRDDWQPISTVIDWTLEAGYGLKTVYLQLRDEAGNISDSSASILLDNSLPALNNLSLDIANLSPAFDSSVTSYSTTVANNVYSISVTAVVYDEHSIVSVNGITVSNNVPVPVSLNVGANVIPVVVTSQNNGQLLYTITVNRQPSFNADLKDLTVANAVLSPGFAPDVLSYQTSVGSSYNSTTVIASVYDADSTLTINGQAVSSGAAVPVNLNYGMNDIEIIVKAADGITTKKYTIHVQRRIESGSNESSDTPATATPEGTAQQSDPSIQGFAVFVNGLQQEQIAEASIVQKGGATTVVAAIDALKLKNHLAKLSETPTVVINVASKADEISAVLTGDAVKALEDRNGILRIETPDAAYEIPADLIAIGKVSAQLGSGTPLPEITIYVSIAAGTAEQANLFEQAGRRQGFTLTGESFDFSITAAHSGKSVRIEKFDSYVKREISIPEGVDPTKITTAVVLNADGSVHHVPTAVTVRDGKYAAVINSLTNSSYSLIWNQKSFADVQEHWAKEAVEDMASRLVVTGMNANEFQPDASITRAEFAALLVRGLGLSEDSRTDKFKDVASDDWYMGAVQKAVEYRLIEGYEDGTFGPHKTITREEALVLISRAMNIVQTKPAVSLASLSKFEDHSAISSWAAQDIANTVASGLVQGTGSKLEPKKQITRAETAALIQRLLSSLHLITERE